MRLVRPLAAAARAASLCALLCALLASSVATAGAAAPRKAALQVSAGDGATDAEAGEVEAGLFRALAAPLEKRGFQLVELAPLLAHLRAQGVPEDELHAPMNSAANTARLVRLRELDVELHWFMVLTRDGGKARLVHSAVGFHDLATLDSGLAQAESLPALEAKLAEGAPALVEAALAKFKPVPMPAWWRPYVPAQTSAQPSAASPPAPSQPRLPEGARVAVLDFKHGEAFSTDDARYLSDVVRAAALKAAPRLGVMTRENLLVLLQASGKELADCEGECEVDTGRRIGADAVVSGDVLKFGARFNLSLRLHETKSGRLLAAVVASGTTLEELDADLQARAAELLAGQR